MDFYVGECEKIRSKNFDIKKKPGGLIEGEIIALRNSRSIIHAGQLKNERRKRIGNVDPGNAKILVLMIEEGTSLPEDFNGKKYKALVRFSRVP